MLNPSLPWQHSIYIYIYTHTHCLSSTKCSLTRCNCQVRGPVIFCSLHTKWFVKWACRNARTTKHFEVYTHVLFNTHTHLYTWSLLHSEGHKLSSSWKICDPFDLASSVPGLKRPVYTHIHDMHTYMKYYINSTSRMSLKICSIAG